MMRRRQNGYELEITVGWKGRDAFWGVAPFAGYAAIPLARAIAREFLDEEAVDATDRDRGDSDDAEPSSGLDVTETADAGQAGAEFGIDGSPQTSALESDEERYARRVVRWLKRREWLARSVRRPRG